MAWGALVSLIVLIFVGATVRVTGAGMGCPDWPKCWGCWVPPTQLEQVDFAKLDIEVFQKKAQRMGRDPNLISEEILRKEFNSRHVWTEFLNRCTSLPIGFFSVATVTAAIFVRRGRRMILSLALASLALVLINAVMGARVVYSGLAPGVLTLHMFLAFLLIISLTLVLWLAKEKSWKQEFAADKNAQWLPIASWILLVVVLFQGIMGSQIREITDELSKHQSIPRTEWGPVLENTLLYLIHRSFSWVIFFLVGAMVWSLKKNGWKIHHSGKWVTGLTLAQMVLGVIMSQIHVYGAVQVLHVGLSAIMVSSCLSWALSMMRSENPINY
jgi:cytochrome c oxidase assembly protein subunit 15